MMRALAGQSPPPAGFDADKFAAAARSLRSKRREAVVRVWPALVAALGESFRPQFDEFAALIPLPHHGGPRADGHAFACYLADRGLLPDAGRLERLQVTLHHRPVRGGLLPRRLPALLTGRLPQTRRLVVGVFVPGWGGRVISLPSFR